MVRREENRRILAVDDDEDTLSHYLQIFTHPHPAAAQGANQRLLQALQNGADEGGDEGGAAGEGAAPEGRLARLYFQLDCFTQGEAAVEALQQALERDEPYAVALIDMRMLPGIDGLETARRIRRMDETVQIIFITAYSDYGTDHIFRDIHGPVFWFRKPFESEEMYTTVRSCCDAWNQAHELSLLRKDLADRVDLQTERLQAKVQSVMVLQKNSLKRELMMGDMKRELRSLKAYQDLRLLLKDGELGQPRPFDPQLDPVRLLLVDDSPTVRAINKSKLETLGYAVSLAESVDEAFRLAESRPFEVALIDFYMPGGNGDRLISMLRSDPETMYILPLLFTNAGDEMMAVESGAVYWMTKDQPAEQFTTKMALLRDYVQESRSFQAGTGVLRQLDSNRRILLVDDDPANLEILDLMLSGGSQQELLDIGQLAGLADEEPPQSGRQFEVTCCRQGGEAIIAVREAQFEERPFAVAMIDMRMPPGLNGVETARQLRQLSPQIDIIIMSAYSDHSLEEIRAVLGENFSYLNKPFRTDEVLQRVIEGCAKWAMVREVNASHHALLNLADDMERENARRREAEKGRAEASRALQLEKRYMEEIFSSMHEPLLVVDHSGRVEECNTALLRLAARSRESVVGWPVERLFEREASGTLMGHFLQLLQQRLQQVHDLDPDSFHHYLRSSEAALLVLRAIPEGESLIDGGHPSFLCSQGLEQLLGYPQGALQGAPLSRLLGGEALTALTQQLVQAGIRGGCGHEQPLHWQCADGGGLQMSGCLLYIRCGEHHHYILHLNEGKEGVPTLHFVDALTDMLAHTESGFFSLRALPQVARESAALQPDAVEAYCLNSPLPMLLCDAEERILALNGGMQKLCGWGAAELLGEPISQLLPRSRRSAQQQRLRQFLASAAPVECERELLPLLCHNGDKVMVELGLVRLQPESGSGGDNAAALLLVLQNPRNREPLELFKGARWELFELQQNERSMGDHQLRVQGGEPIPVALSGALLHRPDLHGGGGLVVLLHDLRERRKSEQREQYAAYQQGVAEMTANILHNIGNTIQGIDSASKDVAQYLADLERVRTLYQRMVEQLAEAEEGEARQRLVEKVLEASGKLPTVLGLMQEGWNPALESVLLGIGHIKEVVRLQHRGGEIGSHTVHFSVEQLLDDLQLLTRLEVEGRGYTLQLHCGTRGALVRLPRNPLIQALINLIKNAAEAIEERLLLQQLEPAEGVVELRAEVDAQWLTLVVRDNGNGIDPQINENLLRFGYTTKCGGSGFGLHASGNFVNAHGGTIKIESEGVGLGATVTMRLPRELL